MLPVRHRLLCAFSILIVGVAAGGTSTFARETDKSWEFGPYVALSRYANASDLDTGFGFGVRGGYHIKAIHLLEGSIDSGSTDHKELSGDSVDVNKYSVDYVRIFLVKGHEKMTPFAAFGFGLTKLDDGTNSLSSASYRAGGGFKFYFKPRIGLRFDLRAYRWHGDGHVTSLKPFFSLDATVGATFLFGGTK